MTVEFLEKRIEGKKKEIEKLEKKLSRIHKAKDSNWTKNPYYYSEHDLTYTEKDLDTAKKALSNYEANLVSEKEKAESRNIKVILDFLDMWKARMEAFYVESLPTYLEERKEWYRIDHEYTEWFNHERRNATKEEWKRRRDENYKAQENFYCKWKWLTPYLDKDSLNMVKLTKDLEKEANAKYDFIIERTNAIVGKITDASNLKIGAKGDLNGIIIGERGKAKVQTVGAGGYNIQCFHFRTLINGVFA